MKNIYLSLIFVPQLMHAMIGKEACELDNIDQLKTLMAKDQSIINQRNNDNWTLLHFAAYNGSFKCIEFLLNTSPALINAPDKNNNLPFAYTFCGAILLKKDIAVENLAQDAVATGLLRCTQSPESIQAQQNKKINAYKKSIELFVSKGADIEHTNTHGTGIDYLIKHHKQALQEFSDHADICTKASKKK